LARFQRFVKKATGYLNEIAGWAVAAAMLIIVINVVARKVFKSPIMGAFEYASFFITIAISFGLAYCAVTNGHIIITIFAEKLNERTQKVLGVITDTIALAVLVLCTARIVMHAGNLIRKGEVSATTQTPFYIFVYLMAVGFGMLCLVQVVKLAEAFLGSDAK
jgi:TRAP-type C4-dicarboxylate transport system permease small subunit